MTADAMTLARPQIGTTIRNYISLTKPRIIVLLLITTVPAMVVAEKGWPDTWLVIATLIGGTLSAGGANAINCWYDRDIDGIMVRTRSRPVVTGAIEPAYALAFGFEGCELSGGNVADNRQVIERGPQVLAKGQNLAVVRKQVAHHSEHLLRLFAETEHQAGLGGDSGIKLARCADQAQRLLVARAGAHRAIQARDGFRVVVQHVGTGIHYNFQSVT